MYLYLVSKTKSTLKDLTKSGLFVLITSVYPTKAQLLPSTCFSNIIYTLLISFIFLQEKNNSTVS